ncbi:hypothetical protein KHS38_05220 [Mucilaginibacter sp. Bleaf8]|uniref:hypothetical protein n=1 Tax=Mucilaginibacter sp. Bleaf8 TaxID=2834430 RepID=UPI001BCEA8F8|nr:hypothetical protein [Mucilaginibacter sp. Bleaf8]MBS7563796.1 hypothetical protein [Mucilaginibacter sp. Bleaf8]
MGNILGIARADAIWVISFTIGSTNNDFDIMIDYFYYKLYCAVKKSSLHDTAAFTASMFMGGLLGANIFVISGFLAKENILPFMFSNKNQAAFFGIIFIIISSIFYLSQSRYKSILRKYSSESNSIRIKGNLLVMLYVVISFLLIFLVAYI